MGGNGFLMRIFQKAMLSTITMFTAASLTFPIMASAAPLAGVSNYTVQSGDSFWKIANKYGIPVQSLLSANSNLPVLNLQIGTNLIIPLGKQEATAPAQSDTSNNSVYAQNLYWMAHVINAEANAEPMEAKVAVGDVVMHRLEASSQYQTIHDVVFAVENGHYQFSCVANGYIYSTPNSSSLAAANEVLNQHVDVVPGASVFFNPAYTPASSWVWNQPYITKIGDFVFSK